VKKENQQEKIKINKNFKKYKKRPKKKKEKKDN
jgi:hypothetical protein